VRAISRWAASLQLPSQKTTFFNFLASHDGIGLNPVREILSGDEIERIIETVQKHGGLVSYKNNPDGTQSPYELNISYFDALSDPASSETIERQAQRFAAAHAVLLALVGVPGLYFHSLFGSRSWQAGVAETGRSRTINRQKLSRDGLERELSDTTSLRSQVFQRLKQLLQIRASQPAFHPHGEQAVIDAGPGVFALRRISLDGKQTVLCLQNVTDQEQTAQVSGIVDPQRDLVQDEKVEVGSQGVIALAPYQTLWLVSVSAQTAD
jgi:glucosylglycerate phosphorylase